MSKGSYIWVTNAISWPVLAVVLTSAAACQILVFADDSTRQVAVREQLPRIRVHNPTPWEGPSIVEVLTGHLASPGLVDWNKVCLVADDGSHVPFTICEGRPHWKAGLMTPIDQPRAEDLLTFSVAVKPGTWERFQFVPSVDGTGDEGRAVTERDGQLIVSYPGLETAIAIDTGMLRGITAFGEPLLEGLLAISFAQLPETGTAKNPLPPPRATLVGKSSGAGSTVLHFVLAVDQRLSMAVSYYIHASGAIEICIDERPWHGVSPWVDHDAAIDLSLKGASEALPYLENRAPFYGFKDFAAAVSHVAVVHRCAKVSVVELGEETTNGRRWTCRLLLVPSERSNQLDALVEAADKGLIIETEPMDLVVAGVRSVVWHPPAEHLAAERLSDALQAKGTTVQVMAVGEDDTASAPSLGIELRIVPPADAPEIEGDGFDIRTDTDGKRVIVAAQTRFGLLQAVRRMSEHIAQVDGPACIPLIASNPAVRLRAGGFGGGDFEVDFPHGSESEWHDVLETLAASGMNVMADLGMWSNWKMPVSYRLMPELQSSSPDAYDEVSGARLGDLDMHRERGLRLLQFLHDRGVKVWLWLPVGCVPTTYAQQHPDAMAPGKPNCPCFTHPLYNRYLEAFLSELLETYPIDGIVMIRDDNGGLCPCPRCKDYVEHSQTKSAAWEQYLILYRWLRARDFRGDVAVYPYWDYYQPQLDPLLPADLLVVGHGSGATVLARDYEWSGPMGDTWLDNVFASFRVASTSRTRRLLSDRNAFWIGGALRGSELPWQSIGRFGWEPTESVNTFRYQWAAQQFGRQHALSAVALLDTYEQLWELYDLPLLPREWMTLTLQQRAKVSQQGRQLQMQFGSRLAQLRAAINGMDHDAWLRHVELFGVYFAYQLRRLELFAEMHDVAAQNRQLVEQGGQLAEPQRQELLAAHGGFMRWQSITILRRREFPAT